MKSQEKLATKPEILGAKGELLVANVTTSVAISSPVLADELKKRLVNLRNNRDGH